MRELKNVDSYSQDFKCAENDARTSGFGPKGEILSSHDILRYFNTRFYQVTYSDLLRHAPKYSGDLLLNLLSNFALTTPSISKRLDSATILGFVDRQ